MYSFRLSFTLCEKCTERIIMKTKTQILKAFEEKSLSGDLTNPLIAGGMSYSRIKAWLDINLSLFEKAIREETLKKLKVIEKQRWDDADHCSCLGFAINQLDPTYMGRAKRHVLKLDDTSKALTKGKYVYNCRNCPTSAEAHDLKEAYEILSWPCPQNMMAKKVKNKKA